MGKWLKQFESLIWAAMLALTSLAFVYQSFATKEYVDVKHNGVLLILEDIRDSVKKIDERTYELARKR